MKKGKKKTKKKTQLVFLFSFRTMDDNERIYYPIRFSDANKALIDRFYKDNLDVYDQLKDMDMGVEAFEQIQAEIRSRINLIRPEIDLKFQCAHLNPFYYQFFVMSLMDLKGVHSMQQLTDKINDGITSGSFKNHCFDSDDCACACSKMECRLMTFQQFDKGFLLLGSFCIKKNGMIVDEEAIKYLQKKKRDEKKIVVCYKCSSQKTRADCEYGKRAVFMRPEWVYICRECIEKEKVQSEAQYDARVRIAVERKRVAVESARSAEADEKAWIEQKEQQFSKNRKLFQGEQEALGLNCLLCNKTVSANQYKFGKCCFECNQKKKDSVCKCGKTKKSLFPTCWECKTK